MGKCLIDATGPTNRKNTDQCPSFPMYTSIRAPDITYINDVSPEKLSGLSRKGADMSTRLFSFGECPRTLIARSWSNPVRHGQLPDDSAAL